jgi:hypothetical protein
VSFTESMFDELGERRRRLHAALGPYIGGLIEFALFSGMVVGVFALFYGKWLGLAPLAGFLAGYALLDLSRQRALAAGASAASLRRRHDLLALALAAAMAVLGATIFFTAMQASQERALPAAPPQSIDLEIVK